MKKIGFIILLLVVVALFSVDTERTRSQLETIFADNTTGGISAQDLRDFLASVIIIDSVITDDGTDYEALSSLFTFGGSGDLDGNGTIGNADLNSYLLPYFQGDSTFTVSQYLTADVNGDGFVNYWDGIILKSMIGKNTPISISDKLDAFASNQSKFYSNGTMLFSDFTIFDIGNNFITGIKSIMFGANYISSYATIDSTDAKELQTITDYADSITTGTDVIYLWKDGKRAEIIFATP